MKARRFLAVVLAVTLLLLGLGAGAWWLVWQRSPLQLQRQPLVLPRAARFVPRDAALSVYLLSDAEQPLAYARAVAPPRQRRQAAAALAQLRDGAFAAAGLNYDGELASWLGPEIGLWLLEPQAGGPSGWVLALPSRDGDGARRFLQRFWQSRSLAGTDLQVSSYRGMGLISGRGALVGQAPLPLATALIDDDLVLLASGRGALEQALDVSQIDDLNQAADPDLRRELERLGSGVALVTARADALAGWLGAPASLQARRLVAALRPQGLQLVLAGVLSGDPEAAALPAALPASAGFPAADALLASLRGEAEDLALLQQPALWPASWRALLQPLLQPQAPAGGAAATDAAAVPALLLSAAEGPVLWRHSAAGWLLATAANQPAAAALEPALRQQGLVLAPLELEGATVQAWTRVQAAPASRRRGGPDQLQATLAAASTVQEGWLWWSDSLAALVQPQRGRPQALVNRLAALAMPEAALQWAGGQPQAQQLLQRWSLWRLLSALAGQPLAEPVQGVALALQGGDGGQLSLQMRLDFAS